MGWRRQFRKKNNRRGEKDRKGEGKKKLRMGGWMEGRKEGIMEREDRRIEKGKEGRKE